MADERRTLDQLLTLVDAQLGALLARFAGNLARRIRRAGGLGGTIAPSGRAMLAAWLADALGGLFGTSAAEAEALYATPGTLPHLLATATRAAAGQGVAPAIAQVSRVLADEPALLEALTRPQPVPRPPLFDPVNTWRDPNGHRLSDRVWLAGEDMRSRIDALLDYHITAGTTATDIAPLLERFLTPGGARPRARTPDGQVGSYAARRLARTEVTRAHGAATVEAARANPFAAGIKWNLSPSHPAEDACDVNASRDDHGLGRGVYRADAVPTYPDHPHDMCYLTPVPRPDTDRARADLGAWARGEREESWGGLDTETLVRAVTGFPRKDGG